MLAFHTSSSCGYTITKFCDEVFWGSLNEQEVCLSYSTHFSWSNEREELIEAQEAGVLSRQAGVLSRQAGVTFLLQKQTHTWHRDD